MGASGSCIDVVHTPAVPANVVDPSYFQAAIGYTFGDTTVSASWYSSEDFVAEGSEGTALGIGVNHAPPKGRGAGLRGRTELRRQEVRRRHERG